MTAGSAPDAASAPEAAADEPRVTLLTRTACHLCGPVRATVSEVCSATGTGWSEVNVDDDVEMRGEYGDQVPVVLVDGAFLASLTLDAADLKRALEHGV